MIHMLQYWLQSNRSCSWSTIIEALREIDENALAETLASTYGSTAESPGELWSLQYMQLHLVILLTYLFADDCVFVVHPSGASDKKPSGLLKLIPAGMSTVYNNITKYVHSTGCFVELYHVKITSICKL